MFTRPSGSKKIARKAQNDSTRAYHIKYHGLGRENDEATKQNEEDQGQTPPWSTVVVDARPCVSSAPRFFFAAFRFPT